MKKILDMTEEEWRKYVEVQLSELFFHVKRLAEMIIAEQKSKQAALEALQQGLNPKS